MYKGSIVSDVAITANKDIPFETVFNDGKNTDIRTAGIPLLITPNKVYEVEVMLNLTNIAAGDVDVYLMADGDQVLETTASLTSGGTSEFHTVTIPAVIRTKSAERGYVTLSAQIDKACTIAAGVFIVK